MAVKVTGIDPWIHHSQVKLRSEGEEEALSSYSCEPLEDLKLLFKRTPAPLHLKVSNGWNSLLSAYPIGNCPLGFWDRIILCVLSGL
jgi:hypothetical protein